jgi:superfamily I DNA/RNA helicase/mRNA-degrading endonuclease RelE of RelBE toxin-antitoxin system
VSFEIVHKPTFTNQLLAIPRERVVQILEKIERLREDPSPHGNLKKKLHGYKGDVYRLRSGDYRVLYSYGNGWVTLLGVDDRKDVYKGDRLLEEELDAPVSQIPDVEDILKPASRPYNGRKAKTSTPDEDVPLELDEALLRALRVPTEHFAKLTACKTLDDLLATDVPEYIRERVFDAISSPDYEQVLQQPDLLTGDVSDLLRFKEGELLGFLLKLDPDQEMYVTWAVDGSGPTLVKGGPGTGKSTIALYRARSLVRSLREVGIEQPRILFTTYTNALVAFSEQLLERLLGPDQDRVTVRTADSLIVEIVSSVEGPQKIADASTLKGALKEAFATAAFDGTGLQKRAQRRTIERLSPEYLLEEIGAVIEAREISSLEEYLAAPRAGRRVGLNSTQRTAVWRLHESLSRVLGRRKLRTWHQVRRRAVEVVRAGEWDEFFDGVLVDEAQDLDATVLRLLIALCRDPSRLFVTADANQSIYGSTFRWSDVHADLRFRGRTGVLRANHRSTQEIGEAAHSYLRNGGMDDTEEEQTYTQTGPKPAVRAVQGAYDESRLLARFMKGAAKEFRLGVGACAALVPSEGTGRTVAAGLKDAGIDAVYMPGRELDLGHKAIKVITLKSAKGLEFPVVAVAGFVEGAVPGIPRNASEEELEEALRRERRTVYVAMTRAMRALLVITPAERPSSLLTGFDPAYWNTHSGDA